MDLLIFLSALLFVLCSSLSGKRVHTYVRVALFSDVLLSRYTVGERRSHTHERHTLCSTRLLLSPLLSPSASPRYIPLSSSSSARLLACLCHTHFLSLSPLSLSLPLSDNSISLFIFLYPPLSLSFALVFCPLLSDSVSLYLPSSSSPCLNLIISLSLFVSRFISISFYIYNFQSAFLFSSSLSCPLNLLSTSVYLSLSLCLSPSLHLHTCSICSKYKHTWFPLPVGWWMTSPATCQSQSEAEAH